ncbi:hypothetical protein ACFL3D_01875 [Candidatus Omnitrophota bacterium]
MEGKEKRYYGPFNLDIPRMGFIILYKHDKGIVGDLIKKQQLKMGFNEEEASFTHVEVSGGGPWAVYVGTPRSSVIHIKEKYRGRTARIVRIKIPAHMTGPKYWRKLAKVAFWAATHCNLKYDFLGIAGFLTSLVKHAHSRYFCSENTLWAIHKEFDSLPMQDDNCMPAHFTDKDYFSIVWEGVLR